MSDASLRAHRQRHNRLAFVQGFADICASRAVGICGRQLISISSLPLRIRLSRLCSKKAPFPSVFDAPTRLVTVVVPAYNESARIQPMMDEMLAYLQKASKTDRCVQMMLRGCFVCQMVVSPNVVLNSRVCSAFTWEIVVVDDGSKDDTAAYVQSAYVSRYGADQIRVCKLFKNNGKGGAVRKGMLRARGQYLLMADADGATQASDLGQLQRQLRGIERDGLGIAVGSRAHLDAGAEAKAKRTPIRKLLMWGFHTLMSVLVGGHDIEDTQCGFKMFTRK